MRASLATALQDLVFVVRQVPDDRFQREGDDLIVHVRIRLPDALSEGKVDIPHLDGRILRVPLKEVRWRNHFDVTAVLICCTCSDEQACVPCLLWLLTANGCLNSSVSACVWFRWSRLVM